MAPAREELPEDAHEVNLLHRQPALLPLPRQHRVRPPAAGPRKAALRVFACECRARVGAEGRGDAGAGWEPRHRTRRPLPAAVRRCPSQSAAARLHYRARPRPSPAWWPPAPTLRHEAAPGPRPTLPQRPPVASRDPASGKTSRLAAAAPGPPRRCRCPACSGAAPRGARGRGKGGRR